MNINYTQYPAVRLLLIILLGVIVGVFFDISYFQGLYVSGIFFVIAVIFVFMKQKSFSYYPLVFSIGLILASSLNYLEIRTPNKLTQDFPASMSGKVLQVLKSDTQSQRILLEGDIDAQPLPQIDNCRAIIDIRFTKNRNFISQGEQIVCFGKFRLPTQKQFPNEFDEKNFCRWNSAQFLAKIDSKQIGLINYPNWFDNILNELNGDITRRITKLYRGESAGVILALINGDRSYISFDTKQAFSLSGTAHVLSVSGLHVGIIATIIFFLLGFISNKWIKFAIFSIIVTFYVVISGVQDAAVRSAMMAIGIVFLSTLQREFKFLNLIAFVTVIAIIIKPALIISSGFQMSVLSVMGIAIFFGPSLKLMELLLPYKNSIAEFFKSSIAVSLAASIVISPLVGLYFNMFSLVSPLANLFVIPLMSLALIFGFISLLVSYISFPIAILYAYTGRFMVDSSIFINNATLEIPGAFIKGGYSLALSIISSVGLAYLVFSKAYSHFTFRLIICSIGIFLSLNLLQENDNQIKIYPRKSIVLAELPAQNNTKIFVIADRFKRQKVQIDYGFESYIRDIETEKLLLLSYGREGKKYFDNLKSLRPVKFIRIDENFLINLQSKLKMNDKFYKLNTYD